MMEFTRRKFLRLAPASVGAIALGVAVLPKLAPEESWASYWEALGNTMLRASSKVVDPPLLGLNHLEGETVHVLAHGFPSSGTTLYINPQRRVVRRFGWSV